MRCSDCSKEVKPVVAIDIDGTLGDYHGHLLEFAEAYLGIPESVRPTWPINPYLGDVNFGDWFCSMYQVSRDKYRLVKLAYRQGGMKRSMPVYDGAASLVNGSMGHGCEVWLTTTRPYLRLDTVDPDTRAWLDFNHIEFDSLLYDERKYERLAELVDKERVIAVVDDLPEMYDQAAEIFGENVPILRKTVWNQKISRAEHVFGLGLIETIIYNRQQDWIAENSNVNS